MSRMTSIYHKVIQNHRLLDTGLMILLGSAVIASFQLLPTDHAIVHCLIPTAPFEDCFICQCPLLWTDMYI